MLLMAATTLAAGQPTASLPPTIAVYGDSYTTGYQWGGIGSAGWPAIVAQRVGARVANDGVGGTGYVNLANGATFPYAAAAVRVDHPSLVVVFGGFNDRAQDSTAVRMQAVVTFTLLRDRHAGAPLLVVGPEWPATALSAAILTERDQIRSAAGQVGATYVDPSGWFQGHPELIGPDGIHPTDAGHELIADRLTPVVAGLLPRGETGSA